MSNILSFCPSKAHPTNIPYDRDSNSTRKSNRCALHQWHQSPIPRTQHSPSLREHQRPIRNRNRICKIYLVRPANTATQPNAVAYQNGVGLALGPCILACIRSPLPHIISIPSQTSPQTSSFPSFHKINISVDFAQYARIGWQ